MFAAASPQPAWHMGKQIAFISCLWPLSSFPFPSCHALEEERHPSVQLDEKYTDYLPRTEQYWIKLARHNMGPDAKEKKVAKLAHAMAKTFYEGSV